MLQMAQPQAGEDPRLWAAAYIGFFITGDMKNVRLLERDVRYMSAAVGSLAFFLMDAAYMPMQHGVRWTESWVEVDARRRIDPELRASLIRRSRYRRVALGRTMRPKHRLRRTRRDVVNLLWLAYQYECHPKAPELYGSQAILAMLRKYRERFVLPSE
jgi:hypothetical protein